MVPTTAATDKRGTRRPTTTTFANVAKAAAMLAARDLVREKEQCQDIADYE